jgi:hypothetical protein
MQKLSIMKPPAIVNSVLTNLPTIAVKCKLPTMIDTGSQLTLISTAAFHALGYSLPPNCTATKDYGVPDAEIIIHSYVNV